MLKKIAKKKEKKYTGPPPHEQFIFLWGTKGKKLPLGDQEKKSSSRGLKKGSFSFLWSPKGFFFPFGAPKEVFFPLVPQRKKNLLMGGRTGIFFHYFFGNFFQHVKKLINFGNFVKIKVAKFKLNHLG